MGYGFGFLLSLVKLPCNFPKKPIHLDADGTLVDYFNRTIEQEIEDLAYHEKIGEYAREIATACKLLMKSSEWFPEFGMKCSSGSRGYGCGDQDQLWPELQKLTVMFPDTIFAIYHFYRDFSQLCVWMFSDKGKIREDTHSIEELDVGPYKIHTQFDLESTTIPNNITIFIHEKYGYEFNWEELPDSIPNI